jgi:hypothetical protein
MALKQTFIVSHQERLSPGLSILVMAGLSSLCWAVLIVIARALI